MPRETPEYRDGDAGEWPNWGYAEWASWRTPGMGELKTGRQKGGIMSRPHWKGSISVGLDEIPVDRYPAENRNRFDLTLLDRRDLKPMWFKRYHKVSGKDIP